MWAPAAGGDYERIGGGRSVWRGVLACGLLLAGAAFLEVTYRAPSLLSEQGDAAACSRSGGVVECSYGGGAFWDLEAVRGYFLRVGVSEEEALNVYLPTYRVRYAPALMGAGSAGALTAFALYLPMAECESKPVHGLYAPCQNNGTYSSFLVVADVAGALRAATVVTDLDSFASTRFDAVKMADPSTVLAYSNVGHTETGYLYTWKWDEPGASPQRANDAWSPTSHDVQLAFNGEEAPTHYWQPGYNQFAKKSLKTGAIASNHDLGALCKESMNHLQLLHEDAYALVSCRLADHVILYYDVANRTVLWSASGGKRYSTLSVGTEEDGAFTEGGRAWAGQHNVEAFGDRIYMFDNAYETGKPSRILRLRVDVSAGVAAVDWSYDIPFEYPYGYSEVYGDADLLPSGNVLTNWWPARLSPSRGLEADLYLQEITFEKEVAWEMAFYNSGATVGGACTTDEEKNEDEKEDEKEERDEERNSPVDDGPCDRQINLGWKAYSVERFYPGPIAYVLDTIESSTKLVLEITAHASLKRQHQSPGSWAVLDADGAPLSGGTFDFRAHQLATTVRIPYHTPGPAFDAATVRIADEWGQAADLDLGTRATAPDTAPTAGGTRRPDSARSNAY